MWKQRSILASTTLGTCGLALLFSVGASGTEKRVLTDAEAAQYAGNTDPEWCWPNSDCDDPGGGPCLGGMVLCNGKNPGEVCQDGGPHDYFAPEECNSSLGNEYCSSSKSAQNVICDESFRCICEDNGGQLFCTGLALKQRNCVVITTDIGCRYQLCPN
jgi:hypothetical protein